LLHEDCNAYIAAGCGSVSRNASYRITLQEACLAACRAACRVSDKTEGQCVYREDVADILNLPPEDIACRRI